MTSRRQLQQLITAPIVFPHADPEALARFNVASKWCVMNCGPHRDDPRNVAERRLLCGDCLPVDNAEFVDGER